MNRGVTLKDIAERLNMSISTVSKALSDDPKISILTKERVIKKAEEWNYVPNESARHFKLNKSFTIGLVIPDLLDQFYVLAINGVEEIAAKQNYNLILSQSHENSKKEESIINLMIKNRIDGIIIAITKDTVAMALFEKLKGVGIPVVCISREPQSHSINYVCSNNREASYKATSLLIKKGHQRIAHIMGPHSLHVSRERLEGYQQALIKHQLKIDKDLIKEVDFSATATANAVKELMELSNPPTGIFTFKNYMTLDAIDFLKKKYPQKVNNIDFVGFGNLPLLKYLDYKPLASVEESSFEMGEASARLLFELMNESNDELNENPKNIEMPCKLILHKTSVNKSFSFEV